jgi:hypothetical protein
VNTLKPNGKIHPVAEMFPMMPDDEINELATDLKENGQLHPIILDKDGTLIDGRQRQEACKRAGIKPVYETLNGQDPVTYILSSNDRRRHMTKGQRAMIAAKVRSLNNNYSTTRDTAKQTGVTQGYVNLAVCVLEYAKELTDAVLSGDMPLNDAYRVAQERKAAIHSQEAQIGKLRKEAPDLVDLVAEERMTLPNALAALRDRKEKERQHHEVTTRLFAQAVQLFDPQASTVEILARHLIEAIEPKLSSVNMAPEHLQGALDVFTIIVEHLKGDPQ